MNGFKQYIEALSSHGGYWFQRDQESKGLDASGKDLKFDFPNYVHWDVTKMGAKNKEDNLRAEKTYRVLTRNYKDVMGKVDERLMKLDGVNFHIYFGLPENIKKLVYDVNNQAQEVEILLDDYFFGEMGIPRSDIVFVKTGPSGDILTPWMVLHTIGHAITDSPHAKRFYNEWAKIWLNLATNFDVMKPSVISCLFNFRSARIANDPKINTSFKPATDIGEIRNELFASYLWNGGKVKRPTVECIEKLKKMPGKNNYIPWNNMDEVGVSKHLTIIINKFYNEVDNLFKRELDSVKGHVIFDLFPNVDSLKSL